jgi:hypothetical protein
MKLQIEGQSLRVRIGEEELARLQAGGVVSASTAFARAFTIICTLRLGSEDAASLSGQPHDWQIKIPEAAVREHSQRLPTREGLKFILAGPDDGEALELLFDVDVRDSVRQRKPH